MYQYNYEKCNNINIQNIYWSKRKLAYKLLFYEVPIENINVRELHKN